MKAEDLIALNDEIAGMARAGLPLDQGLAAIAKEMGRGRLRSVTTAIANDLRSGHTLPQALERRKGQLPAFYSGLVAAGVRTGRVGDVLATLTTYARTVASLRMMLIDAFFYPCVVLAFGLALFLFLSFVLLPQMEQIYTSFGFRLPWLTEAFMVLGRRPKEYVGIPLAAVVLLVILAKVLIRFTRGGRILWAHLVYAVPVIGTLIRAARLAAFTELLAILVDHQTPLPEAFRLAGEASSDPVMASEATQIEQDLTHGKPLGQVLRGRGLVPEWVSWMTGLGERRGTLAESLYHVATMYRRQVEMRASLLKSVLPPFLIIGLAGTSAFIFIGVLMAPMLKLLEGLSR